MTNKDFAGLGLPSNLVRTLAAAGFETPTPIQAKAIPAQLQGRDILGIAQTGSGKTAAFGLPILAGLMGGEGKRAPKTVGALILAPTRELAVQIEEMIRLYSKGGHISTALVLGGVSRQAQVNRLARGVDVLIATPGRLLDLLEDKKVRLDRTRYLVLDEADRMLDMGFIKPVRRIAAALAPERQTALFSATMADEVGKLAASLLTDPVRVEAAPQGTTVTKIDQSVVFVPTRQKRGHLNTLLSDEDLSRVIVFARTKHGADRVAKNLSVDGHAVAAIHGNKSQNARQSALRGFRDGRVRVLVATDIAARGIDVPEISHVINYDLPDDAENYVHRIGRTGRNGASGTAISLVDGAERSKLRDVEKLIRQRLPVSGEPAQTGADTNAAPTENEPGPVRAKQPGHRRPQGSGDMPWRGKRDANEAGGGNSRPPKSQKSGKPRWNKRRKDAARAQRASAPRHGAA